MDIFPQLGVAKKTSIREIREKKVVSSDGVHLERWGGIGGGAENLICRIVEEDVVVAVGRE
jgi:hypothetical protein